jgi:hypothetical protein
LWSRPSACVDFCRGAAVALALTGSLFLSACQNIPAPYAPPEQRQPFESFAPYRVDRVVNMGDSDAERNFIRDIGGAGGTWRWTGKHPELHVFLRTNRMLHYVIDFTIVEATFKDTGPVTVSFFVNSHLLDKITYKGTGPQHFEKPVPEAWVESGKDAIVGAEIDKTWITPGSGAPLGFVLSRMGLRQE